MKPLLSELDFVEGAMLLIDKPYGVTSFGVVNQLKKWTKAKIGHAGTLDPLASGLMICCTGKWTKKLQDLTGKDKKYTASICLGATTPTYDLESLPENFKPIAAIKNEDVEACVKSFCGVIKQLPPIYSALKQDGVPLYKLARKGEKVIVKEREVTLYSIEIVEINFPTVVINIHCTSGTYIRSLAYDIGAMLGCGAYMSNLIRTEIAEYKLEDAYTMEEMIAHFGSQIQLRKIEPKI
jgi:tRNA pseudouridine55 synthase